MFPWTHWVFKTSEIAHLKDFASIFLIWRKITTNTVGAWHFGSQAHFIGANRSVWKLLTALKNFAATQKPLAKSAWLKRIFVTLAWCVPGPAAQFLIKSCVVSHFFPEKLIYWSPEPKFFTPEFLFIQRFMSLRLPISAYSFHRNWELLGNREMIFQYFRKESFLWNPNRSKSLTPVLFH